MNIYEVPPIDDWTPWLTEAEYKARLDAEYGADAPGGWAGYLQLRERALEAARRLPIGWEGDFRQGPFIGAIPPLWGNSGSEILIAWKQDNNGTCFVASPFPLPWLIES